jgi:hypothetical protein
MQLRLFDSPELDPAKTEHGGDVRPHRRKIERPVSTRRPMHYYESARGAWSMRRHQRMVRETLRRCAARHGVRI